MPDEVENSNEESEAPHNGGDALRIVAIGASAGGLSACKELLEHLPAATGMAFVVIFHMAPSGESHLAELLSHSAEMPVSTITARTRLCPDHIYVIAPGTALELQAHDTVTPRPRDEVAATRKPIDTFFEGLAKHKRERAIGVVLSGSGDDGAAGLAEIKRAGGIGLVQRPESAEFKGMPRAAINAGLTEYILPLQEMGEFLGAQLKRCPRPPTNAKTFDDMVDRDAPPHAGPAADASPETTAFHGILKLLAGRQGVDFRDDRHGTLKRRILRRVSINHSDNYADYLAILQDDANELDMLYQDLLIDMTQFFRDPEVWEYLEEEVMPALVERSDEASMLRFWVSACSTGEEAYSLGIIALEALEAAGKRANIQIFATDVNTRALEVARCGRYPAAIAEYLSEKRLKQYFEPQGAYFQVKRSLRDRLIFAHHNLLVNPPFSRMNLVTCRNLLIYLKPQAQQRALKVLNYALEPCAYLVLGASESIEGSELGLEVLSKKLRVYQASPDPEPLDRSKPARRAIPHRPPPIAPVPAAPGERHEARGIERSLERHILSCYAPAVVVVNKSLEIRHFYGPTDDFLHPPMGAAELDLLGWLRPGLYAGLHAALKESMESGAPVETATLQVERDGQAVEVKCQVEPLVSTAGSTSGAEEMYLVVFRSLSPGDDAEEVPRGDLSLVTRLETQLREARREQRHLREELNVSREDYQAHHEELLSLNEELQSSNEELESSKEVLQALNEELRTVNRQLEVKNEELDDINVDLNNLFVSANFPSIFLDEKLKIRRFSPASTRVMRLVESDIGRPIGDIKGRFDTQDLSKLSQVVLESGEENEREIRTDDGRYFAQRILPYRSADGSIGGVCITFSDVTEARNEAIRAQANGEYSDAVIRTVRTALLVLDADLRVVRANRFFRQHFMEESTSAVGTHIFEMSQRRWDIPRLRDLLQKVLPERHEVNDFELEHDFAKLGHRVLRINAHKILHPTDAPQILLCIEDMTERTEAAHMLEHRRDDLELERARKNEFLAMLGHELRNPLAALTYGLELLAVGTAPERIENTRQMMERQLHRMMVMLDQLLEMSRVAQGKIVLKCEPLDLGVVAQNAIEVILPRVEKRHQHLSTSLPGEGELILQGDANRLAQVMENLLFNAVKYTDDGGYIEVKLEQIGKNAVFSVRDTGMGIEAELMPSIFDLFVQSDRTLERSEGGFGLGLPLARELVELHGGELTAYSAGLGKGSTFTATIPVGAAPETAEAAPETDALDDAKPTPGAASEAPRILVIDDEVDLAALFMRLLQRKGFTVKMATDGLQGIELARSFRPRVILLDLGLPGLDGYEIARRLREEFGHSELLLVAVSGYERDDARLRAAGFDRHLLKPPDMTELEAWIKALD